MTEGKFIVFEGLDGSGKTSQASKLNQYLKDKGIEAFLTSEPYTKDISKVIRGRLRSGETDRNVLTHLFLADRAEHVRNIEEMLEDGVWIISDRYWFSNYAYQGVDMKHPYSIIEMNKDFLKPDYLFYIDTDVDVCMERIGRRKNKKDTFERKEFLEKVREEYESLWDIYYHPVHEFPIRINGNQDKEKVFEDIKKYIEV